MDLKNTTAIVTGAASGLGAATAEKLRKQGARVIGFDLPSSVHGKPQPHPDAVQLLPVDVTQPDQVAAAVDAAASEPDPLRVVVNCAGIAPSARIIGRSGPHDLGLFAQVVTVNLIGTFNVLAVAAQRIAETPQLHDGQRGVIVNAASVAAFEGQIGQAAYASSKGGVVSLTLAAARDLAQFGIRVNTIAPGIVETPMMETITEEFRAALAGNVPFPQRLADPSEYADVVAFLLGHDYLNGETIRMDGALRMAPR